MTMARARRGFTMVELVLVLAIVSVIAAIAIPRFSSAAARYRVKAAARRVAADLQQARAMARATSSNVGIKFTVSAQGSYRFSTSAARDVDGGNVVTLSNDPYLTEITKADFAGTTIVSFNGFGIGTSGSVMLRSSQWQATVNVDGATGSVTIQDP